MKRERRSGEIQRREGEENDKVEKKEDNANVRERKIGVGALPSLLLLPLHNNEEEEEDDKNVRGGGLGLDQVRDETIDDMQAMVAPKLVDSRPRG